MIAKTLASFLYAKLGVSFSIFLSFPSHCIIILWFSYLFFFQNFSIVLRTSEPWKDSLIQQFFNSPDTLLYNTTKEIYRAAFCILGKSCSIQNVHKGRLLFIFTNNYSPLLGAVISDFPLVIAFPRAVIFTARYLKNQRLSLLNCIRSLKQSLEDLK